MDTLGKDDEAAQRSVVGVIPAQRIRMLFSKAADPRHRRDGRSVSSRADPGDAGQRCRAACTAEDDPTGGTPARGRSRAVPPEHCCISAWPRTVLDRLRADGCSDQLRSRATPSFSIGFASAGASMSRNKGAMLVDAPATRRSRSCQRGQCGRCGAVLRHWAARSSHMRQLVRCQAARVMSVACVEPPAGSARRRVHAISPGSCCRGWRRR